MNDPLWGWLAALAAAGAGGMVLPGRPRWSRPAPGAPHPEQWWVRRYRWWWCLAATCAGAVFVGGWSGVVAGALLGTATWFVIDRATPPAVSRASAAVRRDLPHLVALFALTLRGGAAPGPAVALVCAALPGPAADRLAPVTAKLALGIDPAEAWQGLAADPDLAGLGRTMARAQTTGSSVVAAVQRLAEDLAWRAHGEVEDRARAVGVRAALPLGLCLLPSFLLLGIAPLVAGLLGSLTW